MERRAALDESTSYLLTHVMFVIILVFITTQRHRMGIRGRLSDNQLVRKRIHSKASACKLVRLAGLENKVRADQCQQPTFRHHNHANVLFGRDTELAAEKRVVR